MITNGPFFVGALVTTLCTTVLAPPKQVAPTEFTLTQNIPSDVFLCVAARHNPEREFLDRYWGEVFEALKQSGVGNDVLELIGSLLDGEQKAEFARLKERASELLAGVDWEDLAGKEMVFAERLPLPTHFPGGNVTVMPHMVVLLRGSAPGAARNFEGLVAILEGVVEEINRASGSDLLAVARTSRLGAQVAALRLQMSQAESGLVPAAVALRDDIVLIAIGEPLLNDVLDLMNGSGAKKSVAADPRFKAAFAKLPAAKDSLTFFDMQALMQSLRGVLDTVVGVVGSPGDIYANASMSPAGDKLNMQALAAYQRGDHKKALELVQQAYEVDPKSSIVLYNLACFNALGGHREEALDWLEKAVAGGFYAPDKISTDSDLESVRDEPRFKASVAKAAELAGEYGAEDVVKNSSKSGEAAQLTMQAWQAYEKKDYEQGLKLTEQAYAVAPQDSRVLYYLACFHTLLGHTDKALDFLQQAVEAGFYCPRHIAKDPDLESLRKNERYQAALAQARKLAGQQATGTRGAESESWKNVMNRIADAVGLLDYVASVESTDGYAVRTESLATLVPDAKKKPFYPVLASQPPLTDFARFVPQEAESFSVSAGINLRELYRFIEDSIRLIGPHGEELLTQWAELQEQFGVNVQKDVLAWLDGEFISVDLEKDGGSVWLIRVTDEQLARAKVGAALEFLSTKLTENIAKNPALAALAMLSVQISPLERPGLEGFQNLHFTFSPRPAAWGVAEQHLIFGTSADAVALCLATARGTHPNVRSNARVMSEALVPNGPFASVTLTDQRELGAELAHGIGIVSMVGGMLGAFIPEAQPRLVISKIAAILAKLTPVVRKIDFYKSTAASTTFDGQVWHTRGVTHYFSPEERAARNAATP